MALSGRGRRGTKMQHAVRMSVALDEDLMDRLNQYCDELGQTKTTAVTRILQKHLDDYFSKQESDSKV